MPSRSSRMLVRMESCHVAMFRFLLEAHDNLALFTVLERRPALLMLLFAEESRNSVLEMLEEISASLPICREDWPIGGR